MSSNLAKAGFGIGILGVAAVLAVSIITLVKVNDNKSTTLSPNTIYNQTIYNNTIYDGTIYNNTIYNITAQNNTIIEYYFYDNGTDANTLLHIPANAPSNTVKYQEAAKFFANSIDTSVSPCDDFYQYACGKYSQDISFDIAETDNRLKMANSLSNAPVSTDPLPLQQIRKMYQQCIIDIPNMGSITANGSQIMAIYNDFLTTTKLPFPLLARNTNLQWPNSTQLSTILGYSSGKYGVDTLVSQYIDTNWKDPQGIQPYLLFFDQPALSLPYTYYIGKTWDITKPSLTKRVFQTFQNFNNISSPPLDLGLLNSTVDAIVNFEYLLANNYSTSDIVRWQSDRSYNLIKIKDFNTNFTSLDINTFINNIAINVNDMRVINRIKDPNYEISIAEPMRLMQMNTALMNGFNGQVTATTFANYMYYRILDANIGLFPAENSIESDEFLDLYKMKRPTFGRPRFEKNFKQTKKFGDVDIDTKLACVDDTINYLQYANARIFIDVIYPTPQSRLRIKTSVGHVVDSILVGMQSMIDQLSWMSADSKKGAYSKIQNLIRNIAYPEWITDNGNLTKYYSGIPNQFMSRTDYLTMLNDLNIFNAQLYFDQLRRTRGTDRTDWNGPPGIVNAWYQPELNSISFPAAILRQPFFDPDWPASVNFGSMGVVAGHELSHGFDSSGTQWDGFGQLLGWLDPMSKAYFDNMTQCVINEYNGFCPLNISYSPNCINGQQTVGENVADNGGIHSAFRAYRNAINFLGPDPLLPGDLMSLLSHDQLFFLSFAQVWCQTNPAPAQEYRQLLVDPHSPSKYRVLGTIQNFPAFRTAFNCPVNSASAPANHCNVWISDVNITKETASSNVLNVPETPLIKADNNLYTKYSQAQSFFKAALNLTADPCNDFYNYACGAYNKPLSFYIYRNRNYEIMANKLEQIIQPGYNEDMADSEAIIKLTTFYKKCKNVTAVMSSNNTLPEIKNGMVVQTVFDEFRAITNYTFNLCETASQNTNADPVTMAKALAFLSIKYGVDTLVTPFVDVNAQRNLSFAANFTLYIDQNTVTYAKPYYQPGAWEAYTQKTLTANAMKLVSNFAASRNITCRPNALKKNIDAIVNFEHLLATNYSTDETTRRNFLRWINPKKVSEIPYTFADWKTYVSELARLTGVPFTTPTTVSDYMLLIAEPDMIAALNDNGIPIEGIDIIVKYFYYRLLLSQQSFVYSPPNSTYVALYHESGHALGQKTKKQDPYVSKINVDNTAISCAEATQDYMQYANARVFTEALYKTDSERQKIRDQTRKVISAIRNSMQAMLDDLTWISNDPATQQGARDKIMKLQLNLAFPDFIMNNTLLDEYHEALDLSNSDSYFSMLKKLQVFNQYQNYINLTSTHIDRSNFLGPPGTVNAWYQPEMNSITIPEGILQPPYFDPDWPASIKFGAMGVIIGHELTHGFDDQGVQWDGTGVLKPWMSPDAQKSFKDMAQCVVDEYSNFTAITNTSYYPTNINGEQTQGENIADNGGIHSGYLSYQRWVQLNGPDPQLPDRVFGRFTHDQLFFLSFAQCWCQSHPSDDTTYRQLLVDPHSPSKFRVFGTIQNFPAFRKAFNCPVGSVYAPQDHCSVWVPNN
jgi:predicted metalloendopeptidase